MWTGYCSIWSWPSARAAATASSTGEEEKKDADKQMKKERRDINTE
jgi:hypothetical protein